MRTHNHAQQCTRKSNAIKLDAACVTHADALQGRRSHKTFNEDSMNSFEFLNIMYLLAAIAWVNAECSW